MDPQSLGELESMVLLNVLNEAALLHNVRKRYAHDAIYTTVGDILVAVNPFKQLPIYDKSSLSKYIAIERRCSTPYTIADHAYRAMLHSRKLQAVCIAGESVLA